MNTPNYLDNVPQSITTGTNTVRMEGRNDVTVINHMFHPDPDNPKKCAFCGSNEIAHTPFTYTI